MTIASRDFGRPYCFLAMPFGGDQRLHAVVREVVEETMGLACYRHDTREVRNASLSAGLVEAIQGAVVVVADLGGLNSNVLVEVGLAVGRGKRLILLVPGRGTVPANLRGEHHVVYGRGKRGLDRLRDGLRAHLFGHGVAMVTRLLIPRNDGASYLVANPRRPGHWTPHADGRHPGTFGDDLGVRGILAAFGAASGQSGLPELLTMPADEKLCRANANLFLVGSPKVHPGLADLLRRLQRPHAAGWSFRKVGRGRDVEMQLTGRIEDREFLSRRWSDGFDARRARALQDTITEDHGLLIRGPHPDHRHRTVTVLAGAHSLGTGAAALAATTPRDAAVLAGALTDMGVDIEGEGRPLWALVRGRIARPIDRLTPDGVTLLGVGVVGGPWRWLAPGRPFAIARRTSR